MHGSFSAALVALNKPGRVLVVDLEAATATTDA